MPDTMTQPKAAKPAKEAESKPANAVRLFIEITVGKRTTLYGLIHLDPHPEIATKAWRLIRPGTEGKKFYDVAVNKQGWYGCTCADATYRQHDNCKHIRSLLAMGLLVEGTR